MRFGFALALPFILTAACRAESSDSASSPGEPPRPFAAAAQRGVSPDQASFTLTASGLIAVHAVEGRGSATTLNFGDARENVLGALETLFGKPRLETNRECSAGPMEFADFGPITANFQDGKFIGWLAKGGADFDTTDGIEPGERFAELAREHGARMIAGSTLDGEFELAPPDGGAMGGFVDSRGRVVSLYAGTNCFFR